MTEIITKVRLRRLGRPLQSASIGFAAATLLATAVGPAVSAVGQSSLQQNFAAAAQEFGVPEQVLLALSYNESHWQTLPGESVDGGYGLMDLRAETPTVVSGRDGRIMHPANNNPSSYYTLNQAAGLLHVSATTLETNQQQNIRGAAAVLAQNAKQLNGGKLPSGMNNWYGAVAKFGGASDSTTASEFANDVFNTVKTGASMTTTDNQAMNLPATPNVQPNTNTMSALNLPATTPSNVTPPTGEKPECPSTLNCRFIPAAYAQDDPNDPTNYGNYDPANRPKDMAIKYIFIHDTEGSYDSAISHFQDPTAYDSAQYVVRSSDGAVTQMVRNQDVSWGVYDWYDNMHGINIENEGFAAQGATWYTPAMYQTDATLVRWLAAKYNIPLDRQHILGHDNIPVLESANFVNQHWDPGPFWNWNYFMDLVHGDTPAQAQADVGASDTPLFQNIKVGDVVTIDPKFTTNEPPVSDCQTGTCVTLPKQGASFVYLYTQPSTSSPLLSDPYLHPDNSAGTTEDNDWGDKAPAGFQYVVASVQGSWTAIWYAGQKAWFYNPTGVDSTAVKSSSLTITPKPGLSSISVYGGALPEASAYPSVIPMEQFDSLYTIPAGQAYTTTGQNLPTDYYYDATINYSLPDDHAIVHGKTKYYQIAINHRIGYVKAADVTIR